MEATSSNKIGRNSPRDILSSRGGAITIATIAAILAGVLLFAFVQRYRNKETASSAPTPVFVAKSLIPQGSSADVIGAEQLLQRTTLRGSQVRSGAITDPSVLHGEVAATTIYPGQQITASDFVVASGITSELTGTMRAVSVPVDAAHGLVGFIHTGDHVDVLASFTGGSATARGTVTTLLQDVLVLSAPSSSSGLGSSNNSDIVLRVSNHDAPALAYAADNGKVWAVLRPPLGAVSSTSPTTSSGGH
jgi:Flp pilus assembly protein CpaB